MKQYIRKCSLRCYNAKGKKCCCICEGKNHGTYRQLKLLEKKAQLDTWKSLSGFDGKEPDYDKD